MKSTKDGCAFCEIVEANDPGKIVWQDRDSIIFEPINPVVPGHLLVVPREHVDDFADKPIVSARAMRSASYYIAEKTSPAHASLNLITSMGAPATQTVFHLHLHLVPREWGDGVRLPWESHGHGDADPMRDVRHILEVLGLGTHARPYSTHDVVVHDIIPEIGRLMRKAYPESVRGYPGASRD